MRIRRLKAKYTHEKMSSLIHTFKKNLGTWAHTQYSK